MKKFNNIETLEKSLLQKAEKLSKEGPADSAAWFKQAEKEVAEQKQHTQTFSDLEKYSEELLKQCTGSNPPSPREVYQKLEAADWSAHDTMGKVGHDSRGHFEDVYGNIRKNIKQARSGYLSNLSIPVGQRISALAHNAFNTNLLYNLKYSTKDVKDLLNGQWKNQLDPQLADKITSNDAHSFFKEQIFKNLPNYVVNSKNYETGEDTIQPEDVPGLLKEMTAGDSPVRPLALISEVRASEIDPAHKNEIFDEVIKNHSNNKGFAEIYRQIVISDDVSPQVLGNAYNSIKKINNNNNPKLVELMATAAERKNAPDEIKNDFIASAKNDFLKEGNEGNFLSSDFFQNAHLNPQQTQELINTLASPHADKNGIADSYLGSLLQNKNIQFDPKQIEQVTDLSLKHSLFGDSTRSTRALLGRPELDEKSITAFKQKLDQHRTNPEASGYNISNIDSNLRTAMLQHGLYDDPNTVHVTHDANKLREMRDFIEQKGGKVNKKELEAAGMNTQSLGAKKLIDGQGMVSYHSIQQHIDALPKTKFGITETEYGDSTNSEPDYDAGPGREAALQSHRDDFSPSDYGVHTSDHIDMNAAREDWDSKFDPEDEGVKKEDFKDAETGEFDELAYDRALDQAQSDHNDRFDPNDYDSHEFLDEGSYNDAMDRASEQHDDDFRYDNNSEEVYKDAFGEQRHNHQPSQVVQVNASSDHIKKMKEAGVFPLYQNFLKEFSNGSHPTAKNNGIGWVRYTQHPGDKGIHIDEIQTDLGQDLSRRIGDQGGEDLGKEYAEKYPPEKMKKLEDILFGNKHASEVLHEAFLQHMRNKGEIGNVASIWTPVPKAIISGQKPTTSANRRAIEHFHDTWDQNKGQPATDKSTKYQDLGLNRWHAKNKLKIGGATPEEKFANKNKALEVWHNEITNHPKNVSKKDPDFEMTLPVPLPVHMQEGYGKIPEKMGYKPSKYGQIKTQNNPAYEDKPTQSMYIRKSLKKLGQMILAEQGKLQKSANSKKLSDMIHRAFNKEALRKDFMSRYKEHIKRIGQAFAPKKPGTYARGSKHALKQFRRKRKIFGTGPSSGLGNFYKSESGSKPQNDPLKKSFQSNKLSDIINKIKTKAYNVENTQPLEHEKHLKGMAPWLHESIKQHFKNKGLI